MFNLTNLTDCWLFTGKYLVVWLVLLTIVSSISHADNYEQALKLHDAARDGENGALESAIELLEQLKSEQPESGRVTALLGSVYGISARDSWNPLTKTRHLSRCLDYIDEALELGPEDIEVRLTRAFIQIYLPRIFGRRDEAIEDIIVLDRLFREQRVPEVAPSMLHLYEKLLNEEPELGDWSEGIAIAKSLFPDHAKYFKL